MVAREELRLAPLEPEPRVPPGHMLVQFFNDNNRFEVMDANDVQHYRNTRAGVNEGYAGTYAKPLRVAVEDMEKFAKERGWSRKGPVRKLEEAEAEAEAEEDDDEEEYQVPAEEVAEVREVKGVDVEFVLKQTALHEQGVGVEEGDFGVKGSGGNSGGNSGGDSGGSAGGSARGNGRGSGVGDVIYLDGSHAGESRSRGKKKEEGERGRNEPVSDNSSTASEPINEGKGTTAAVKKKAGKRKAVGATEEESAARDGRKRKKKVPTESVGTPGAGKAKTGVKVLTPRGRKAAVKKDGELEALRQRVASLERDRTKAAAAATKKASPVQQTKKAAAAATAEALMRNGVEMVTSGKDVMKTAVEMINKGQTLILQGRNMMPN